ncbi:MAG: flippase [Sulfurimonadaceae bacterium]
MKYFKNTSWLFGEKILRMVVGLFVGIWVARYLGPEQFGLFSYAQSFVGLFTAIATLGLDGIVMRELVKDPSRRDELIGTAFWLKLVGAIAVLVLLAVAVNFTSNDYATNILVFIIASATIFQAFNVVDMYFQAKVLSKYVVYANVISLFLSSVIKIALILSEAPLIAFAWVVVFDSFVLACGFIYFYLKHFRHSALDTESNSAFNIKSLKFSKATAVALLRNSWPLILSGIVISIYMKIDQVMIKEMMDAEAVGQYAAALRISEATYFIPMVIASSLFPAIINAKAISEELYYARLQKLYDVMIWIGIFIAFPLWYFSDFIIVLLFGVAYEKSIPVLKITIWILVLIFIASVHGKWLIAEGLQKYNLVYSVVGVVSNVAANYYFIPRYGIIGAAYGTVFAQIVPYCILFRNKNTRRQFEMILEGLLLVSLFKKINNEYKNKK